MGLDGVELVMEMEEAFGITMADEEAANCLTPRMVIDLIFSKLKAADEHVCRSQRAFYRIRKVLVQGFGIERKSVTPDSQLRDWIPRSREEEAWEQIRAVLPYRLPGLARPLWMRRALMATPLVFFGMTILAVIRFSWNVGSILNDGVIPGVVLGFFTAGLGGFIALWLTRPFCVCIPARMKSVRDIIPRNLASDRLTGWTREEVAAVVKRLTCGVLGLKESQYTEDSQWVQDLGMDR